MKQESIGIEDADWSVF